MAGRPVVVGPHMENFAPLMRSLLSHQAVIQVPKPAGSCRCARHLDPVPRSRRSDGPPRPRSPGHPPTFSRSHRAEALRRARIPMGFDRSAGQSRWRKCGLSLGNAQPRHASSILVLASRPRPRSEPFLEDAVPRVRPRSRPKREDRPVDQNRKPGPVAPFGKTIRASIESVSPAGRAGSDSREPTGFPPPRYQACLHARAPRITMLQAGRPWRVPTESRRG